MQKSETGHELSANAVKDNFLLLLLAVTCLFAIIIGEMTLFQNMQKNKYLPSLSPAPQANTMLIYSNQVYGFAVNYNPEIVPMEIPGTEDVGQFTYLYNVKFGDIYQDPEEFEIEVNKGKSVDNHRLEIVGHIADSIDKEDSASINGVSWTLLSYKIITPENEVSLTRAVTVNGNLGYAITASPNNINSILSSWQFTEPQSGSKPPVIYKACTMDAKICPDGTAVGRIGPNCEFAPCP